MAQEMIFSRAILLEKENSDFFYSNEPKKH
jgi:hypothetical protein